MNTRWQMIIVRRPSQVYLENQFQMPLGNLCLRDGHALVRNVCVNKELKKNPL